VTVFTACKKDWLDVPPIGKLSETDFYKTDEDATSAIMATYDILQWMYARDWNSSYLVKTFPSDESNTGGGDSGDQPPYQELDIFTYSSNNATITAVWQSNYFGIYRANKVINNVLDENDYRKQVIAEAQFLRAYFYMEIVTMFGTGPLILQEPAPSEYAQPFASADAIWAQIETDLKTAMAVLPEKSAYGPGDVFRASKGACQALLGKAYLYQKKWPEAVAEFNKVISSGEYQLQDDFSTLFLQESEYGVESIFEVSYVTTEGYDWGTFQWGGNRAMENNITWQLTGPRGDYFQPGESGLIGGWGFNYPRQSVYDPYIEEGDVVRRPATLLSKADLQALGGDWTNDEAWGWDGFIRVKYGTRTDETDAPVGELNYGTNLRLIRFADVLLMAAEANFRAGNAGAAAIELNKVRARAGLDAIQPTGDAMFQAIVKERQMELAFEGVRFLDLIRWGIAKDVLGQFGYVDGKHNVYPIPADEMRANNQAAQNPGY
jgi:hypothetical protein